MTKGQKDKKSLCAMGVKGYGAGGLGFGLTLSLELELLNPLTP